MEGTEVKTKPAKAPEKLEAHLPASIEDINKSVADSWDQLGRFKMMQVKRDTLLGMVNKQGMPLIGLDVIKTKQGPRLYINGEGAKFNRESYLGQSGRRMIERRVEMVPYAEMPAANVDRDTKLGRLYFKVTTIVEDAAAKQKLVDAVSTGTIKATEVGNLLKELKVITEYTTYSAFSNQSEGYAENRNPDHILKKGITQCHRRADLEIAMQCVIPEDDIEVGVLEANFKVKADDALQTAAEKAEEGAGQGGVKIPAPTAPPTKGEIEKPGSGDEGRPEKKTEEKPVDEKALKASLKELQGLMAETGIKSPVERREWLEKNGIPWKKSDLTLESVQKAIGLLKGGATEATKATEAPAEKDPEKSKLLKVIFARRASAQFESDDALRGWVKKRWSKGLSEMDHTEAGKVADLVGVYVDIFKQYQKYGFSSEGEFSTFVSDTSGKPAHEMGKDDLEKFLKDTLGDLVE